MSADRAVGRLMAAAVLLFAAALATPALAKEHRKEVFLYKASGKCTHEVDETTFQLSESNDHSKWDVSNDGMPHGTNACGVRQYVILCTYTKVSGTYVHNVNAFEKCNSQPPNLDMNTAFALAAGDSATLICKGKTEGYTRVTVDSGESAPKCAPTIPPGSGAEHRKTGGGGPKFLYHVIDIEIIP